MTESQTNPQEPKTTTNNDSTNPPPQSSTAFPWHLPLYDSHCHPTDIISSTTLISSMKTKCLTIMSTRSQDQELVEDVALRYFVGSKADLYHCDDGDGERGKGGVREEGGMEGKGKVIPSFGWHPWFSCFMVDDRAGGELGKGKREHYTKVLTPVPKAEDEAVLDKLGEPLSLSRFLRETEERLKRFPMAIVGEVGLDRGFRVPFPVGSEVGKEDGSGKNGGKEDQEEEGEEQYTPGSREGRPLTIYRVNMEHQKVILKAQLELAAKHKRAVSVHSVQAHGAVFEVLQSMWKGHERPSKRELKKRRDNPAAFVDEEGEEKELSYPPRICMHSYSGPADALHQFLDPKVPAEMFFSFSELVNFGSHNSNKAVDSIKAVPEDKILVESDLHCAGERMDELLEDIVRRVCDIKGWTLDDGVRVLRRNWERFIFGD